MFFLVLVFAVLSSQGFSQTNNGVITGQVINFTDKIPLSNANISIKADSRGDQFSTGTITDSIGRFKINLPFGKYILKASYVGFETYELSFSLSEKNNFKEILIELIPTAIQSNEVTVTGERKQPSTVVQEIETKDLRRMPTIYNDVLRAVQILPGVSTGSELSSGYNVRGGNFDDNLIYLNGFEIYRPFLLRQGIEENKSLINPDLVDEFRFYNGSFPASYGDKMSSALEVNYKLNDSNSSSGFAKLDLLNAGVTAKKRVGKLKLATAFRYAYPGLFLNELQTNGDYKPSFRDVQVFAVYPLSSVSNIEVLFLYAENKFDLTPTDWIGHFGGFFRGDIRGLDIIYQGKRNYSFITGLLGIKYSHLLSSNSSFNFSAARYSTIEDEFSDLYSEYFYKPSADNNSITQFVKSAQENVNNRLDLVSYEFIPGLKIKRGSHLFTAGINIRLSDLKNSVNESFSESSDTLLSDLPFDRFIDESFMLNSYSAFLMDEFPVSDNVFINAGFRTNYYENNKEFLVSPRATIIYVPSYKHNIKISWGYYYQPPYYAELRNKSAGEGKQLKAQRSIHYSAGWEYQFKEKVKLNIEAYYKDLDNLIPYFIDREKTEYLNQNNSEGFAYGFDLMFQGEIVDGMNSWVGYGYLNTQERTKYEDGTYSEYRRRIPDQTHTLQVFLQDKIKKHPNWQAHTRLLFGSGHLYNLRDVITDTETGRRYIAVSVDRLDEFFLYFRIDMGLSASFDIGKSRTLVVVAEVLNLFDHNNYGGYRFVQIPDDIPRIFAIPQILSKRFFNVSLELRF